MTSFESLLSRDGRLVYKVRGVSMKPLLRQNRDLIVVETPSGRLKKYDVALYRRGKDYVLHRVIGVEKDYYLIRGDNTYRIETVPDDAVIGVLTGFQRDGRQYSVTDRGYRCYARCWCAIYPLRHLAVRARWLAGAVLRKLGIRRRRRT